MVLAAADWSLWVWQRIKQYFGPKEKFALFLPGFLFTPLVWEVSTSCTFIYMCVCSVCTSALCTRWYRHGYYGMPKLLGCEEVLSLAADYTEYASSFCRRDAPGFADPSKQKWIDGAREQHIKRERGGLWPSDKQLALLKYLSLFSFPPPHVYTSRSTECRDTLILSSCPVPQLQTHSRV